ncbi:MAG TPA: cupin domain-containing protein [Dehalococcoidia bacterium]|nr:cupin domain-containing protein [Dehalococcoidia bacterium]
MSQEVRIVHPGDCDTSTAQTPGMRRAEGVGAKTVGAQSLWVGPVSVDKGVKSAPHHHGALESAIYVISGRARFRYGPKLENVVEAEAGDFVFVPPYVVHQEINASEDEPVDMIVARSSQENIVVNVEVEGA